MMKVFECLSAFVPENQVLAVDESKIYSPPDKLQLPEMSVTTSDSAFSMLESDLSSSESSSPTYSKDPPGQEEVNRSRGQPPVEVCAEWSLVVPWYDFQFVRVIVSFTTCRSL